MKATGQLPALFGTVLYGGSRFYSRFAYIFEDIGRCVYSRSEPRIGLVCFVLSWSERFYVFRLHLAKTHSTMGVFICVSHTVYIAIATPEAPER